jgi:hypothetical protein
MSEQKVFTFDNISNFILSNTEISGNTIQLVINESIAAPFSDDFSSDTGWLYDNNKIIFEDEQLKQKDIPTDNLMIHFDFGVDGSTTPRHQDTSVDSVTLDGGAIVGGAWTANTINDGITVLPAAGQELALGPSQAFTFRARLTRNGTLPDTIQQLFTIGSSDDTSTFFSFFYDSSVSAFKSAIRINNTLFFNPNINFFMSLGVEYEIEINWEHRFDDSVNTSVLLIFVDGVNIYSGAFNHTLPTIDDRLDVLQLFNRGSLNTAGDFTCTDVAFWSEALRNTDVDYTPTSAFGAIRYEESKSDKTFSVPDVLSAIKELTAFQTVVSESPKYLVDGLYYNGSAWLMSNGTYSQASTLGGINEGLPTFIVEDEQEVTISIILPEGLNQTAITNLSIPYSQKTKIRSGSFETVEFVNAQEIINLQEELTRTGAAEIKYAIIIDNVKQYWDGSSWIVSDGSFPQLSTLEEINSNAASLLTQAATVKLFGRIEVTEYNDDLIATYLTLTYDFAGLPDNPNLCLVYGYIRDTCNTPSEGVKVTLSLQREDTELLLSNNISIFEDCEVLTDENGYWEATLPRSSSYTNTSQQYRAAFSKRRKLINTFGGGSDSISFTVPDIQVSDFKDLISP